MLWTQDPLADARRYDRQRTAALKRYPVCRSCGEPVLQGYGYRTPEGLYCPECQREAWESVKHRWLVEIHKTNGPKGEIL